jgi:signal transduction histidine kinase
MNLTTQSTLVLLERDPGRVAGQLDHLNQLAQSALSEMRVLITELKPEPVAGGGLAAALRRHLASRQLPESLTEDHPSILICRGPRRPWQEMWQIISHFG